MDLHTQSNFEVNEEQEKFDITTFAGFWTRDEDLYNVINFLLTNLELFYIEENPIETTLSFYNIQESENTFIEREDDSEEDYDIDFKPDYPKHRMKVRIRTVKDHEPKANI